MRKMKCYFCDEECGGTITLREVIVQKKDGKEIIFWKPCLKNILCKQCSELYINQEDDKLRQRILPKYKKKKTIKDNDK